jgi:hypothetical protein
MNKVSMYVRGIHAVLKQYPLDKIINIPAGHVDYLTFSVAQDAVNPRLTGTYGVHGGIIPAVNVYIGTSTHSERSYAT